VLLLLVCFILEIGSIWLGRVQLENALESAALAAVKEWADGGGGDTQQARGVALEFAAANTVTGTPVSLRDNYAAGNTNQNASCTEELVFGTLTNDAIPWVFNAGIQPNCGSGEALAVRVQASVPVNSICGTLLGVALPLFRVSASATARDDCTAAGAHLIRVRPENFLCPGP
jgi:Flp pilus assembly protein TadG